MHRISVRSLLLCLMVSPSWAQKTDGNQSEINRAKARVVKTTYCRGDADLFTVSVGLDVEVSNASKGPVFLEPHMTPWIARMATSVGDAESGRFLFELTQSHYLMNSPVGDKIRVEPGKTAHFRTGYDFVAKYDHAFAYPKALAAGRYAIVLTLRPEVTDSGGSKDSGTVNSLTTYPFVVEVPLHPSVVDCEKSAVH